MTFAKICLFSNPNVLGFVYPRTYCPTGLSTPTFCQSGTYGPAVGQTSLSQCLACPAGTASSTVGASLPSQCVACVQGLYASSAGLAACSSCGSGSFSNGTGTDITFHITYIIFWSYLMFVTSHFYMNKQVHRLVFRVRQVHFRLPPRRQHGVFVTVFYIHLCLWNCQD